jgi:hypothetical protein
MTGMFLAEILNGWVKYCQMESHCQFPISISLEQGNGDLYTIKFGQGGVFLAHGAEEVIRWTYLLTSLMLRFFNFKGDKELVVFGGDLFMMINKNHPDKEKLREILIGYLNIYFDHDQDKKQVENKQAIK